ncbi:hypothetical protein GCM10010129_01660 [Streptomyces fumigatiscleroticus]|nr:hypothetical protein GCM10010129_01660 [Streptomyces fumigatiscleroticus]
MLRLPKGIADGAAEGTVNGAGIGLSPLFPPGRATDDDRCIRSRKTCSQRVHCPCGIHPDSIRAGH